MSRLRCMSLDAEVLVEDEASGFHRAGDARPVEDGVLITLQR